MGDLILWLYAGVLILLFVSTVWVISLLKRDAGIMDVFWGIGFIFTGGLYYIVQSGDSARAVITAVLVAAWGVRLALHIGMRNHGQPEDPRYLAWRNAAGDAWWWRSYFKVFLLQGSVMWVVSLPLLHAMVNGGEKALAWLDYAGIFVWTTGFVIESTADLQLTIFKRNPDNKGKLYTGGLWKYTRHPNYFGESLVWWGFFLISLSAGGVYTVASPVLMTFLLMRVSGVTMLDELLSRTKSGYSEYMLSTNAFFPGLPRKV